MLKCLDCDWTGDPLELKRSEEYRGEFWGMPAYETVYCCPECGSDNIDDFTEDDEEE